MSSSSASPPAPGDSSKAGLWRRALVDLLAGDRGHAHNVQVLRSGMAALARDTGIFPAPRVEEAEAAARWLASKGLAEIVAEGPPLAIRATDRGIAVSEGELAVAGVAAEPGGE